MHYWKGKRNYYAVGNIVGYQETKVLLSQRFGDPYLVSQVYKAKLKTWAPVSEGYSKGLQELSDFCYGVKKRLKQWNS